MLRMASTDLVDMPSIIKYQTNDEKTRNLIMLMFCVLDISVEATKEIVFHEELSASPFAIRPVLVLGKAIMGNLKDIQRAIDNDKRTQKFLSQHPLQPIL